MSTIYAVGDTNDDLITRLRDPDPLERAQSAETIGLCHAYVAMPYLFDAVRHDPDEVVREYARRAVASLMPTEQAAERAIAGETLIESSVRFRPLKDDAAWVVWMWNDYVRNRSTPPYRPNQDDLTGLVIGHLTRWGGRGTSDLDEVELAGATTVGAIARFLGIPNESAGAKTMSFRDAQAHVAAYEAVLASHGEHEEG